MRPRAATRESVARRRWRRPARAACRDSGRACNAEGSLSSVAPVRSSARATFVRWRDRARGLRPRPVTNGISASVAAMTKATRAPRRAPRRGRRALSASARHAAGARRSVGKVIRTGKSLARGELDQLASLAVSDEGMQRYRPPIAVQSALAAGAAVCCDLTNQASRGGWIQPIMRRTSVPAENGSSDRPGGRV